MPVIGAYARVVPGDVEAVRERLEAIEGVETFPLADPAKIGVLVLDDDLERATEMLERRIGAVEGVLGAIPVSVHFEDEGEDDEGAQR